MLQTLMAMTKDIDNMDTSNTVLVLSRTTKIASAFLIFLSVFSLAHATNYNSYQVDIIRPGGDRPCTLFQLIGVSQADPVLPGSPWFSIPQTAQGYKEMVATLLAAKHMAAQDHSRLLWRY